MPDHPSHVSGGGAEGESPGSSLTSSISLINECALSWCIIIMLNLFSWWLCSALTLPLASVHHPHPSMACCNRFKDMSAAVCLMAPPTAVCFYEWRRSGALHR